MTDLSKTIAAKSDQLNADDLLGGPRTIKIVSVAQTNSKEQPIAISYQNDGGKPYKPNLTMRRALVRLWGKDGAGYVGRSLTLFRNPNVTYGALKVGGIQISHLSDIAEEVTLALTERKGSKKAFTFYPLVADALAEKTDLACEMTNNTQPTQQNFEKAKKGTAKLAEELLAANRADLHERLMDSLKALHAAIPAGDINAG